MPLRTVTRLRVFVASPGDVVEERRLLEGVVQELNRQLPDQLGMQLELVKWETHAYPGFAEDPQSVINAQIGDDYQIFVGLLWTRFGAPTGRAESGTLEEFERAYTRWKNDRDSVKIMIYFRTTPISPDDLDPQQLANIKAFRGSLGAKGGLYWTYDGSDDFVAVVRGHLAQQAQEWKRILSEQTASASPPPVAEIALSAGPTAPPVVEDEELGYLELIEAIIAGSTRGAESVTRIGLEFRTFNELMPQLTAEIDQVRRDDPMRLSKFKMAVNRIAQHMRDLTARLKTENPIMRESLVGTVDAYGRVVAMLPEFQGSGDRETLTRALGALGVLKEGAVSSGDVFGGLRNIISRIPGMTTEFTRAKRELIAALDEYTAIVTQGSNRIPEIEENLREYLERTGNDDVAPTGN